MRMAPGVILGLICLLVVQLALVLAAYHFFSGARTAADRAEQPALQWGFKIEAAHTKADTLTRQVEALELQHYKKLREAFDVLAMDFSKMKAENAELRMELGICQKKISSAERMDRKAGKNKADDQAEGEDPLEKFKSNGTAVPLFQPAPGAPARASSFGKNAR